LPDPVDRIGIEAEFGVKDFIHNADLYDEVLKRTGARTADWALAMQQSAVGGGDALEKLANRAISDRLDMEESLDKLKGKTVDYTDTVRTEAPKAEASWRAFSQSAVGQMMDLKAKIDMAKFAVQAFMKPFQQYIKIGVEGVNLLKSRRMFAEMVGGVEEYEEALVGMRAATQSTVKDSQLMASAMKIMRMGMADTAENAAKVVHNVTLLAKAAGQYPSPESAMQVFTMMMANQSKMRLDAFGLSVGEVNDRIAKLKETLKVSEAEAFRIAVFELMNERVESMGLATETAQTKLDQMGVAFENLADGIKIMLVPEFNDFVDVITKMAKSILANLPNIEAAYVKFTARIKASFEQLGAVVESLALRFASTVQYLKGNYEEADALLAAAQEVARTRIKDWGQYYETFEREVREHYEGVALAAEESSNAQVEAARKAGEAITAIKDAWDAQLLVAQQATDAKMADMVTKGTMAAVDAAIAANRKREDSAKATAKQLEQIEMQYASAVAQAMNQSNAAIATAQTQLARSMLQIEENYQKTKRDIQRRYKMEEWEAIAERDATALLRAQRNRDDQLRQADEGKTEQESQAQQQYQDAIAQAQQSLLQQQENARQSYIQQQQDLQTNLDAQAEQQRIADARKEEDADLARARERGAVLLAQGQAIADAYIAHSEELAAAQTHYADMLKEVDNFVAGVQARYSQLPSWVPPQVSFGYNPNPYTAPTTTGIEPWVGAQKGAYFMANKQTNLTVGEGGRRELVMVQPMHNVPATQAASNVNHIVTGKISAQVQATIRNSMAGYEGRITAAVSQALGQVFRK